MAIEAELHGRMELKRSDSKGLGQVDYIEVLHKVLKHEGTSYPLEELRHRFLDLLTLIPSSMQSS